MPRSKHEELLAFHLAAAGIGCSREYRAIPARRFRFDFAFVEYKILAEVQGGLYSNGRHVRGAALENEYEKINLAQLAGYQVYLFTPKMIRDGIALQVLEQALEARGVINV